MQAHLVKWYRGEVWEESFKRFLGRRAYARHTAWKQILDLQSLKKHDAELNDVRNRLRVLVRKLQNANGQKDAQAALDEIRKLIPRINSASKRFTKTFKATVSDAVKVSKQEDRLFYKIARAEKAGRQLVRDTLADIVNKERKKTSSMLKKGKLTEAQAKNRLAEVKKITVELDRRNDSHWQELRRQLNAELDKFTEKSRRQLGNASTIGKVVDLREFVNKLDTPAV
ncbi:MAG: hypothetical protein KJ709_00945, partial [Nanoarchaeota archaeon]|nr:hypothetical protein [Nanoarchaeota archaeon]